MLCAFAEVTERKEMPTNNDKTTIDIFFIFLFYYKMANTIARTPKIKSIWIKPPSGYRKTPKSQSTIKIIPIAKNIFILLFLIIAYYFLTL